jgi:hypothetical protein
MTDLEREIQSPASEHVAAEDALMEITDASQSAAHPEPVDYLTLRLHEMGMRMEDVEGMLRLDQAGNIRIWYTRLDGSPYTWDKGTLNQGDEGTDYYRTRVAPHNLTGDAPKYRQPKGSPNYPFFPGKLRKAYTDGTEIDTLVITEGEFKAIKATHHGLYTVGVGGIHNFKERDKSGNKRLFGDILRIVRKCKVKNLVMLYDADCMDYTWSAEKDGSKRLKSFANAAVSLHEAVKGGDYKEVDTYWGHIRKGIRAYHNEDTGEYGAEDPKGLDDLLSSRPGREHLILEDLQQLTHAQHYFSIHGLGKGSSRRQVYEAFGVYTVEGFYQRHAGQIEMKDFIFEGNIYSVADDGDEKGRYPTMKRSKDMARYFMVGDKHFKEDYQRDMYTGVMSRTISIFDKGAIKEILRQKQLSYDVFIKNRALFSDFINVPENDPAKYQREFFQPHNDMAYYNLYNPPVVQPDEGVWPTIESYLRHLYDNEFQNVYELMLDYLTILYRYPLQKLPILVLVSNTRETGKTTWYDFISGIFGDNAVFIDSSRANDKFNAYYISKLYLFIDELKEDKPQVLETLKSLSTAKKAIYEQKGMNGVEINCILKICIASNKETGFLPVEREENRFLVVKVPKLKVKDPNLLDKMLKEIPAFVHYLRERAITHPKKGRMWFEEGLLETDAGRKAKQANIPWNEKAVYNLMESIWDDIWEDKRILESSKDNPEFGFNQEQLLELLNKTAGRKFEPHYLKELLERMGVTTNGLPVGRYLKPDRTKPEASVSETKDPDSVFDIGRAPVHELVDPDERWTLKPHNGRAYKFALREFASKRVQALWEEARAKRIAEAPATPGAVAKPPPIEEETPF